MITGVSLRLLYLIFIRVLGLVLLMGRTASALAVVTSDNDDQIKGGIWRELIALDATFGLPGKLTLDGKWHAGPSNKHLVAFGRKPSDRNPTGLQGFHARHLLVIIDECCGLPKELWDGLTRWRPTRGTILACGNPTDPTAYMAEVCKPGSGWEVQQIRSTDTAESTGEQMPDELRGVLASASGSTKARMWGCDQPGVRVPHHRRVPRYQQRHPDHAEVDRSRSGTHARADEMAEARCGHRSLRRRQDHDLPAGGAAGSASTASAVTTRRRDGRSPPRTRRWFSTTTWAVDPRSDHRPGCSSAYGTAIAAREPWALVAHSTLCGMTDDDADRPEPLPAKAITALLREARSLSRRADKLSDTAAAVGDSTTQQLAAEACTSVEQLVHHLMLLERQVQRGEKAASRRAP